jgi:chemotaxis protein MotB
MRKRRPPEHAAHERWLVSYADFITLLFAFFTTLYAISTVDQQKAGKLMFSMRSAFNVDFFQGRTPPSSRFVSVIQGFMTGLDPSLGATEPQGAQLAGQREVSDVARKLAALAEDPNLRGRFQVRMEARGLVISLAEAGFFESGSAEIRPDAYAAAAELADVLAGAGVTIGVEGHTDDVPVRRGKFASNWELSTARATAVIAYLIARHLPADRLSASGYGEYKPVASNQTTEGRALNRRVDIVVTPLVVDVDAPSNLTAAGPGGRSNP